MIKRAKPGEEASASGIISGSFEKFKYGHHIDFAKHIKPYFDCKGSEIKIGNYVSFSSGVYIYTHTHHFDRTDWRDLGDIRNPEPTVISDYVHIGTNAQILASCKYIGKHSVIGAGAIVTKDVPDYEIWAGNPAVRIQGVKDVRPRLYTQAKTL